MSLKMDKSQNSYKGPKYCKVLPTCTGFYFLDVSAEIGLEVTMS